MLGKKRNALIINPADNLSSTIFTRFAKLRALRALGYCKLSWEWFSLSPGWNPDEEECWIMSPITGHQLIIGHRRFTSCSHIRCNSRWITNNLFYIPKTSLTDIFWRWDFGLRLLQKLRSRWFELWFGCTNTECLSLLLQTRCLFILHDFFVCLFVALLPQYSNMRNGATQTQRGSAHKALNIIWLVIHFIVDGGPCYTIPSSSISEHHSAVLTNTNTTSQTNTALLWRTNIPAHNCGHSILGAVTLIWNGMANVGRWWEWGGRAKLKRRFTASLGFLLQECLHMKLIFGTFAHI